MNQAVLGNHKKTLTKKSSVNLLPKIEFFSLSYVLNNWIQNIFYSHRNSKLLIVSFKIEFVERFIKAYLGGFK